MLNTRVIDVPFRGPDDRYHYLYMIVNNINQKYYLGVHNSDKIYDSYDGSGAVLKLAFKKYHKSNFTKYILRFFDNINELLEYENRIIGEDKLNDCNCYNLIPGGGELDSFNKCVVKDKDGKTLSVFVDDPRINKTLFPINKGMVTAYDKNGKCLRVPVDDLRLKTGDLTYIGKGFVAVKGENGGSYRVRTDDPRWVSGELESVRKGTVVVKDENGNNICLKSDDPAIKEKNYKYLTSDRLTVRDKDGNTMSVSVNDPRIKTGDLISVNKNRVYINDGLNNKMVYKDELDEYLDKGWIIGMHKSGDVIVNKDDKRRMISLWELDNYINMGWKRGQGQTRPKSGRPKRAKKTLN